MSLAHALCVGGVRQPVILIDRRRSFRADRTWCTWETGPLRFSQCITHRWHTWRTRAPGGEHVVHSSMNPYVRVDAAALYDAALERISRTPQVELRLGESVRSVQAGGRPLVHTSAGTLEAGLVFDALGANSPLTAHRTWAAPALAQRFLGWEVEVDRPVFDPRVATLMDFRPHVGAGATFMYVLTFSPTRALLEHTSIEPFDAPRQDRESAIAAELETRYGVSGWTLHRRERGLIPMTPQPFPSTYGPGVHTLGSAAGAIRPSSGYAFTRIQRQVDRVAAAVLAGAIPPTRASPTRQDVLDRIFLRALAHSSEPENLFLASASVPADAFARFMTDSPTLPDQMRMVHALPFPEMARAALRTAASRQRRLQ